MQTIIKGQNGAKIVINASSMKNVKQLRRVLAKELIKMNIDIGNPRSLNEAKEFLNDNVTSWLNTLKNVLLGLEISDEFEAVMYACMSDCTYNDAMITEQLFDDMEEAREDYDKIVFEVIKKNISPFIKGASGLFAINEKSTELNQQ